MRLVDFEKFANVGERFLWPAVPLVGSWVPVRIAMKKRFDIYTSV